MPTVVKLQLGVSTVFSGAVGEARDERSQLTNKRLAFKRMAESPKFQAWLRKETARMLGKHDLDEEIDSIKNQIKKLEESTLKTYNFKDNRVKNHRTGVVQNLQKVLDGDIEC